MNYILLPMYSKTIEGHLEFVGLVVVYEDNWSHSEDKEISWIIAFYTIYPLLILSQRVLLVIINPSMFTPTSPKIPQTLKFSVAVSSCRGPSFITKSGLTVLSGDFYILSIFLSWPLLQLILITLFTYYLLFLFKIRCWLVHNWYSK